MDTFTREAHALTHALNCGCHLTAEDKQRWVDRLVDAFNEDERRVS